MANRIMGITVEIGGDTTKLQTALKSVNGQIKDENIHDKLMMVYESITEIGADGEYGGGIEMANKIVREIIHAKGIDIGIYTKDFENEYISLTDIAKYRNDNDPRFVIQNWMRNRNTVEFLAVWEELHNPDFNRVQFEAVRSEAGLNRFAETGTDGEYSGGLTCYKRFVWRKNGRNKRIDHYR